MWATLLGCILGEINGNARGKRHVGRKGQTRTLNGHFMGCVAQSITNLYEPDGWITFTRATLPVDNSDNIISDLGSVAGNFNQAILP